MECLQAILEPVTDPEEDSFLYYSQPLPSHSLGFLDRNASELSVSVADRLLTIRQSPSLLTSNRKEGTTGAVVWKVTPLFAEWITSPDNILVKYGCLGRESTVIELGAGVSGVVALSLGPSIKRYIATDQDYVIRLLKQNIAENLPNVSSTNTSKTTKTKQKSKRRAHENIITAAPNIETLELDWELDSISSLPSLLNLDDATKGLDLVIACDCIYNEALIEPLNTTCAQICRLRSSEEPHTPTLCLVAQQLRSYEVFESWLKSFDALFHVWRVPDELLTEGLKGNSGFIVHLGVVR
ncbi:hypothetical protein DM02DRAFT_179171 [Periconia macrospinosa]|uniref:Diaminohydroxyphosphoribosylamino-pyrimidine deaminase n=1 Tax=Periconia macrospinosa TaxID=97972 RepID=A0A2V1E1T9_9PLEO|nr:hypothetical protein DM02DRAFT_179171 [Periconia macrospinosa]